eukprot:TRINITY_DN19956_c0_g3_i1.p1 TRINITY_DN19956_c0_g3~~TRINITY_DN19956_c0_g3_i1.p1  ORF type:complete len:488 (+),score=76.77 TRINITY_DN19956_c0_g3_i1:1377-2840(+)
MNSLDGERKHYQAKVAGGGAAKVSSLARVSRNLIISQYRLHRVSLRKQQEKNIKKWKRQKMMDARALAVRQQPELAARPRGKLHWERGVSKSSQRLIVHRGNTAAMNKFVKDNREALRAESSRLRHEALSALSNLERFHTPVTNREWLECLSERDSYFRGLLQTATPKRRLLNQRVAGDESSFHATPRVYPKPGNRYPNWSGCLTRDCGSFFCLCAATAKIVIWSASARGEIWAFQLASWSNRIYMFDVEALLCRLLVPLPTLLHDVGIAVDAPVEVFKLDVKVNVAEGLAKVGILSWSKVPESTARQECSDASDGSSSESPSDVEYVDSCVESDLEEDDAENHMSTGSEAEDEPGDVIRAPRGTYVTHSMGYCSMSDNPKKRQVTIRFSPQWCVFGELGASGQSRTCAWAEYGGNRDVIYCVLRAWALHRVTRNAWVRKKRVRQRWLTSQTELLKADMLTAFGSSSTGNVDADRQISTWLPNLAIA